MGVRNGTLTEGSRRSERTLFEFSEQCLSKFLASVLHDMSCRMPKYCGGDRSLEEDGKCGLFFCRRSNRPLVWGTWHSKPAEIFRGCLVYFWLYWDGLAHGMIWTWSLNSTAQREPSLRWDLNEISLCSDGDSACTHARTPRTCGCAIHFWQVVLPKQTDAIELSQHREKIGFRKGRNHIHGMFKLTLTMWVCCQELQWSNDGLNETESWRTGGGEAVLNFVGLAAELIGQATGWKERACGRAVSSLKRKRSSVTVQSTVFKCRSQELRWVLRGILITQRTVFRSDLRISRDNYVVNLMPPLFEPSRVPDPVDIHYIHDVMQPGSNHTLCNHRRQHVVVNILKSWTEIVPLFFQYIAWMKCSAGREFPGQWHISLKDNRCQQSSLWRRIDWVSLVGAEYSSSSSFSNSTPLFHEDRTLFLRLSAVVVFSFFFFFSRKKDSPI